MNEAKERSVPQSSSGAPEADSASRASAPNSRYRPITALGQGGMADVVLAVVRGPSGFNKLVVLKSMRKQFVADDELREMFLAEARLSARLSHANVVQVYEVVDTTVPCIVMEYLEGQPMSALTNEAKERFTLPMQLRVISETLAGLHYSHELKDYDGAPLNIVHRDVSPQNIFITYDGVVKVLDFGIAKASDKQSETRTGVIKGKMSYMPREQLLGDPVDRRADVYAVGCMLWHAAAGEKLWLGLPDGDVLRAVIDGSIPKPSEKRRVDPKLELIIMRALAPDPEARYHTALELKDALDHYLSETSPGTTMRDVGNLLSELFSPQQESRKQLIHAVLKKPRSEPPPALSGDFYVGLASHTGATGRSGVMSGSPRRAWLIAIATISVLAILGGVGIVMFTPRPMAQGANTASHGATPQPLQIHVRLAATPAAATLFIDGRPLNGNPSLLSVSPDTLEHEIRVSLAGYREVVKHVRFEHDLEFDIDLQPDSPTIPSTAMADGPSAPPQRSSKIRGQTHAAPVAPPASTKGARPSNCEPPFTFENGIKVLKPDCV